MKSMVEQVKKAVRETQVTKTLRWGNSLVIENKRGFQAHSINDGRVDVYKSGTVKSEYPMTASAYKVYGAF